MAGHLYKISFFTSHVAIEESVAANKEGFIQLGDDQMVFLIYTKNNRRDRHRDVERANTLSWHAHTFYFKAAGDRICNIYAYCR
jgi:hypothetical protein